MYSPRQNKYQDSYVLYIPTVHTFGTVNFTHTILVQTHPHEVSTPRAKQKNVQEKMCKTPLMSTP